MTWTERTDTTNTWSQFQQQEREDVAFDSNIAFDFQVPFDGWTDPDVYWSDQSDVSSSWSVVPDTTTIEAGTVIGMLGGITYAEDVLSGPGSTEWEDVAQITTSWTEV